MRVLVCGGRAYYDKDRVLAVLNKLHSEAGIDLIIEGGANGADQLGNSWAMAHGVPVETYHAFAGPMRNRQMLEEGRPDTVVAFPGGRGTADMVRKARKAGVTVVEISP